MTKILLLTVGGSSKPLLTAIQTIQPDRVIFLCSSGPKGSETQIIGPGTPCEIRQGNQIIDQLPNIPTQASLTNFDPDHDLIRIQDPDDLSECYQAVANTIRTLQQQNPNSKLFADYTGGTKTMSVALASVALDNPNISLHITTSTTRENLIRVQRGEATERARTTLDRTLEKILPPFLQHYNYPAAIAELKTLLSNSELSRDTSRPIRELQDRCQALDAWDRFDHLEAWALLQPYMKHTDIKPLGLFLKKVISSRAAIDPDFHSSEGIPGHTYEIVQDLLLNADRRATQQRYDDAVGRLYRALELLVQIRLLQAYGIRTGDVDIQQLPLPLQEKYNAPALKSRDGKIQLASTKSYTLLSELPDDPLGKLYQQQSDRILNALQVRNHSLFAHGFKPITRKDYQELSGTLGGFIQAGIEAIVPPNQRVTPPQFPHQLTP